MPAALIRVMEEEASIILKLIEALLKEREGIVNFDSILLSDFLREKEELRNSLNILEKNRALVAGDKNLRQIMQEAGEEEQRELESLQLRLKAGTREAKALSRANTLLFKQSLALMEQMWDGICGNKVQPYNESGEIAGNLKAGKIISSSA